jgi:hypothetical protein
VPASVAAHSAAARGSSGGRFDENELVDAQLGEPCEVVGLAVLERDGDVEVS